MSGNSKVIGVTMSRPRSSCHSEWCSVRADTRSYCSLVCVQSLCQSHPTSTLFVWNMESRQPVVFVLYIWLSQRSECWNAAYLTLFCDCLNRIKSTDYVSACGRGACERAWLSALLGPPLGWFIYFISLIYACLSCLQSACSGPSRLFCLTPDHWLHLCPGASGGSDQWPHTGTSGTLWSRRKADSYH